MKTYLCLLSGLSLLICSGCVGTSSVSAQSPVPVVNAPSEMPANVTPLEELVAPIALYPDALVALILPAATSSSDVVLAARYLNASGDPNQIDAQPWENSVKGLARYPEVLKWMDENLEWTQRIGDAYAAQPEEVMAAIQTARRHARDKGLLTDTPQQQVVVEEKIVRIVPAQPDVIYVPRYDPRIIYVERPRYYSPDPWITFGIGFGVGSWLSYDCDWNRRVIWVDHRRWERRHHHDWRHPYFPGHPRHFDRHAEWRQWRPHPGRPRPGHRRHFDHRDRDRRYARPTPLPGAPRFDHDRDRNRDGRRDRDHDRFDRTRNDGRPGIRPARIAEPRTNAFPEIQPGQQSRSRADSAAGAPGQRRHWQHRTDASPGSPDPSRAERREWRERRDRDSLPSVGQSPSDGVNQTPIAPPIRRYDRPDRQRGDDFRRHRPDRVSAPAVVAAPPSDSQPQAQPQVVQSPPARHTEAPRVHDHSARHADRAPRTERSERSESRSERRESGRHRGGDRDR